MEEKKKGTASVLKAYFGYSEGQDLAAFAVEMKALTDEDKAQLVEGIENGTFTY